MGAILVGEDSYLTACSYDYCSARGLSLRSRLNATQCPSKHAVLAPPMTINATQGSISFSLFHNFGMGGQSRLLLRLTPLPLLVGKLSLDRIYRGENDAAYLIVAP